MKELVGDLIELALQGEFDVVIHGCNCQSVMGAGIALRLRKEFPQVYKADHGSGVSPEGKLGKYTSAKVTAGDYEFTVVNAYTQLGYGRRGVHVDYEALRSAMRLIRGDFSGGRIGYPLIGSGLGGGDWGVISEIIEEELLGEDHTVVRLS